MSAIDAKRTSHRALPWSASGTGLAIAPAMTAIGAKPTWSSLGKETFSVTPGSLRGLVEVMDEIPSCNLFGAFGMLLSAAMAQAAPKMASPTDGIFEIFRSHPLVALGEMHGLAQEYEVYFALVQDPRFAAEVGNIILETGSTSKQAIVDRYVNGEHVPYAELREVWADAVGWLPTVTYIGSIRLYAAIKEANAKLPPERRIKVWLGEPPIDWTKIKKKEEWRIRWQVSATAILPSWQDARFCRKARRHY